MQNPPFKGSLRVSVDATDTSHGLFKVEESIPVQHAGELVLLYPEWEPASHAPTASVAELAGLRIHVDGHEVTWRRDSVDMYAFHVPVPEGARTVTLTFDFLAPTPGGYLRPGMAVVPWHRLLLYPAGWPVATLPVVASLRIPDGMRAFTSLQGQGGGAGGLHFGPVSVKELADSPVYAGRNTKRVQLHAGPPAPVYLDVLADDPADLAWSDSETGLLKELVRQTSLAFGPPPYRHYDILVSLSDTLSPSGGGGMEHLEEGENNVPAAFFLHPELQLNSRDLIAHELVHAWNGRWRQPADLASSTFNEPVAGSLLWVYEGQTEFWGRVLASRTGLRTRQQTLDKLALDAAQVAGRTGRAWKSLQDSTSDAIYMAGHKIQWRDWQRREDYYAEGVLLWLDVDSHLRELTGGRIGLDAFAGRFFKATPGDMRESTYTFADVCAALNDIVPADWSTFLRVHLDAHDANVVLTGLTRAGWELVYTDTPTDTFLQDEAEWGVSNYDDAIGMRVDASGRVSSVQWNGPAFRAGLAPGARLALVNGEPFSPGALRQAVRQSTTTPVHLTGTNNDAAVDATLDYRGGLRYPSLRRIPATPDRLAELLTARKG